MNTDETQICRAKDAKEIKKKLKFHAVLKTAVFNAS